MATFYVATESAGFYRLMQGDEICVDFLKDRHLEVRSAEHLATYSVDHFVADQAIPRAMANEGMFVLHAGAVCVGSQAILFMGESGRGKSTLVASFHAVGVDLIGDDALVVSLSGSNHEVQAVYPSLRLFRDSIEAIMHTDVKTSAVTDLSSKRRIDIPLSLRTPAAPLRVAALFTIAEPANDAGIRIRRLSIAETCMAAIENSFSLDPSDVTRAQDQLALASALARQVPAFELSYPRDFARLPDVRNLILKHVSQLN